MYTAALAAPQFAAIDLNQPGSYVHWSIFDVSVANLVYGLDQQVYLAAIVGVIMSVVFNYAVTRVFTWR